MIENLTETIHGTLLSVYGNGVLIRGESGAGKSECALDMVSRGHALVADDAVQLKRIGSTLYGSAPDAFKGFLDIRGLGICDIRKLYGDTSVADRCGIKVSIELKAEKSADQTMNIGGEQAEIEIFGIKLPHFVISNSNTRLLTVIIEAAVKMTTTDTRSAEISLIANYNRSLAG